MPFGVILVMILMTVNCFLRNGWTMKDVNPLSANPTKWSILKQFVGRSPRIVWVFDHFVGLALKGSSYISNRSHYQMFSSKPTFNTPRTEFESTENLNSGFIEWTSAAKITITPRQHTWFYCWLLIYICPIGNRGSLRILSNNSDGVFFKK